MKLKDIIESQDTKSGLLFDVFIQTLIILSLISFSIETLPNLSQNTISILNVFETISIAIFTIEYLARLYVSDRKLAYIISFYGLVDIIAILPYFILSGIDLRSIRIFRLLRVFRILKLFRFNDSIITMKKAFANIKNELLLFTFLTMIVLYVASVGIYFFEKDAQPEQFKSIFHCMWWAIATLTTVGYGDIYPITTGGKIFTSIITLIGIGIVAIPTGLLASSLTSISKKDN
mgnify:FL=1|jgi:voltage-gated potassium channel|tara:strand:- start:104 stop:802 length:699 start_codon:yes stop_codon:yes gene_type:complete